MKITFCLRIFAALATALSGANGQDLDTLLALVNNTVGDVTTLNTFSLEGVSGKTFANFEAETPVSVAPLSTYAAEYSFDLELDFLRVEMEFTPLFEILATFPMVNFTRVLRGDVGVSSAQVVFYPAGPLASHYVSSLKRNQYLMNPHILLRDALLPGGSGATYNDQESTTEMQVLTIPNDVSDILLHVDSSTGTIAKLTTMESSPLVRDAPMEVVYSDWTLQSNGIRFPARVEMYTLDTRTLVWSEDRMAVTVGQVFPPDHFEFPSIEGDIPPIDVELYEYGFQSAYAVEAFLHLGAPWVLDNEQIFAQVDELTSGVYIFRSSVTNAMVVESDGKAVILEGGSTENQGARLTARFKEVFGEMTTVTHVIQSHHHMDHGGAVRTLLGTYEGSSLVVGHGVKEFWEATLAAPSTIRPDILTTQSFPKAPTVIEAEKLGSVVVMETTDVKVTVIHTDEDPHAEDAVLTAIESDGNIIIYGADFYNAGVGLTAVIGGPEGLFNALRTNGFVNCACQSASGNPITFVPSHGFEVTLDGAVSELSELGNDVGCQPVSCLANNPTPGPSPESTAGPTPEPSTSAGVPVTAVLTAILRSLAAVAACLVF